MKRFGIYSTCSVSRNVQWGKMATYVITIIKMKKKKNTIVKKLGCAKPHSHIKASIANTYLDNLAIERIKNKKKQLCNYEEIMGKS